MSSGLTAIEPICSAWITGADVLACGPDDLGVGSDAALLDGAAYDASAILYALTGRQFPGVCEATVRPCRDRCGCWGIPSAYGDWRWGYDSIGGWSWWGGTNRARRSCGCGADEIVLLAGYPILEVLEVKIDGDTVDPTTYALREKRKLWRLDDPGPPVVKRRWPGCQNVTLPDTEPGTFAITYRWGGNPPGGLGMMAAAQLARELYKACATDAGECALPTGVVKVVRQGTTYDRTVAFAKAFREGATGLVLVDSFLALYPGGTRRRPAVWSPDRKRFPRPV